MATFTSDLISKRTKHRGIYTGKEYTVEASIELPQGLTLTNGDILKFLPLGENQVVLQTWAYVIGSLPTATASIGYTQRLDASGNPEVVERRGPFGDSATKYTSPTSDTDAFAADAVLSTARNPVDTAPTKLEGPVDLAIEIGTGGTVGSGGAVVHVGAVVIGEKAPEGEISGYTGGGNYLIG